MSTILDALRKLEEEQQSRTADARSRLLLPSVYRVRASRPQQSPWRPSAWPFGIVVLVLAGFAAGAGLMRWRAHEEKPIAGQSPTPSSAQSTEPKRAAAAGASSTHPIPLDTVDIAKESGSSLPPSQKQPQLAAEITPTPFTAANAHATVPATVEEPAPQASASGQTNTDAAFAVTEATLPKERTMAETSVVQRSPFLATPPAPKEAPPIQREVATAVKRTAAPVSQPPQASKGKPYEVLLPNGALQPTKPATPMPTMDGPSVAPSGTSLSLLQWSSDPERRIAFIRVNGGALTMAHEGDTVGGYKVVEIRQNAVELQAGESHLTLHAR